MELVLILLEVLQKKGVKDTFTFHFVKNQIQCLDLVSLLFLFSSSLLCSSFFFLRNHNHRMIFVGMIGARKCSILHLPFNSSVVLERWSFSGKQLLADMEATGTYQTENTILSPRSHHHFGKVSAYQRVSGECLQKISEEKSITLSPKLPSSCPIRRNFI